jgi:hypothetical protein
MLQWFYKWYSNFTDAAMQLFNNVLTQVQSGVKW